MKVKILLLARKLEFKFNSFDIILTILLLPYIGFSQSTKILVDEVAVREGTTIESNLPTSLWIKINGTVTTNNTIDRYSFNGKNDDVRLNIVKDLEIETWDKNIVKQETTINIKAATKEMESKLIEKLTLSLKEKAGARVSIDCNLNIKKFEMSNGFFKSDDCRIVLNSGKSYSIEYLEIETKLTIPKASNIAIKGDTYGIVRLGELEGDLDLDLKYTEVYGSSVLNLRGNLRWCYNVYFDEVVMADISSYNSYINIKKLGGASIGNQTFNDAWIFSNLKRNPFNSAQTKYVLGTVGLLSVNQSSNDEIIANEVGHLEVTKTKYTSFQIDRLSTSLQLDARNSDLNIKKVSKDFLEIDINNALSDISLKMEKGAEYTLVLYREKYIEAEVNDFLSIVTKKGAMKEIYRTGENEQEKLISVNCENCKFNIK